MIFFQIQIAHTNMLRTEFKRHSLAGTSVSQPTIFDQMVYDFLGATTEVK
jgi:hypothetical protein